MGKSEHLKEYLQDVKKVFPFGLPKLPRLGYPVVPVRYLGAQKESQIARKGIAGG